MSLERKDVRFKLDHDQHKALGVLAQADDLDIAEWVEAVVRSEIRRRVHAATLVVDGTAGLGISGIRRE